MILQHGTLKADDIVVAGNIIPELKWETGVYVSYY